MQIHIQSEHLNEIGVIVRNILVDEREFPADLFDYLGGETDPAPPRCGEETSGWERRIWNGHRDGCACLLAKN